jgi:hypothetical protein
MRLYRSDAGWQEREKDIRADAVIRLDEPNQAIPRHGCIPAEQAAVSPGKIIVPRIVIGGVILDQPAGDGVPRAKHHEQISLGAVRSHCLTPYDRCLVRTKSHKARQKAAGSALSVKLEKYLSRPDYEGRISFIETFPKDFRTMVLAAPGGFEPRDADSERDLNESG